MGGMLGRIETDDTYTCLGPLILLNDVLRSDGCPHIYGTVLRGSFTRLCGPGGWPKHQWVWHTTSLDFEQSTPIFHGLDRSHSYTEDLPRN